MINLHVIRRNILIIGKASVSGILATEGLNFVNGLDTIVPVDNIA